MLGEAATWSITDYLLALNIDAIQHQSWLLAGGKNAGPAPKPIPRPELRPDPAQRRLATNEETLAFLIGAGFGAG
jgi:hypothetical protein